MIRRFTIASGLATLAVLLVVARQGQTIPGVLPSRPGGLQVTAIPDTPAHRPAVQVLPAPPIKALPRVSRPEYVDSPPAPRGAGADADRR